MRYGEDPTAPWEEVRPAPNFTTSEVEKPVIYLFPDSDWNPSMPIHVAIDTENLSVMELWPSSEGEDIEWTVRLSGDMCTGADAPGPDSEHCHALGLPVCEAAEMSEYLQTEVPCLDTHAGTTPALLYNGYPTGPRELRMYPGRYEDGELEVFEVPLAHAWWIEHESIFYAQNVGPSYAYEVERYDEADPEAALARFESHLRSTLESEGLTTSSHFLEAWRNDLFTPHAHWKIFGIYHRELYDEAYPLTLAPESSDTVRVLAVVQESYHSTHRLLASTPADEEVEGGESNSASSLPRDEDTSSLPNSYEAGDVRVEVAGLAVRGQLERDRVMRVVLSHLEALHGCHVEQPTESRYIEVQMYVAPDGSVAETRTLRTNVSLEEVARCVESRIDAWSYGEIRAGGTARVTLRVVYSPDAPP